jgi:hypothetical protein
MKTVIVNGEGQFAVNMLGTKWSTEFPDAFQFGHKKVARQCAKLMIDSVRPIQLVTNYGLTNEERKTILS